ncbi:hypothetical protein [Calothrix sp. PCC 7507]|uniref:hypothetical protein n=1 Tax=Calothrix sp. PCC 7507 TaxID=99598 RepID=UPI00029ECB71|nr:hypothetical protein [Calothrix sp. PCC 7507]AFY31264.1 hypothetical protein Cal7507_0778 [Calothrix sp. PCC 7507]
MSQNPLTNYSGTQSSKVPGLKPALAATLASLEVQLDQELARYRRTRSSTRTLNQTNTGNYIGNLPQQLIAMTTTLENIESSVAAVKTNTSLSSLTDNLEDEPGSATVKTNEVDDLSLPLTSESTKTQNSRILSNSASSIVTTVAQTQKSENLLQPSDKPTQPDDYLESSEALLRSLTDEQPQTKKSTNSSDSLLSPLGIGSMLLLLVASLTLGYIVFNPKMLSQLNLGKSLNSKSSPPVNQSEEGQSSSLPQPKPPLTPIPKYPNLAAKEFPEVRDPNDIVGLQPKVQPTPTTLPNSVTLPKPINPTVALPAPRVLPQPPIDSTLDPTTKTGQKLPAADQPQLNAEIKPSADGFYHVVTDNQSDRSLPTARRVIPDAYLSLDNKLIYLATVKTKQQAQQQLQQLQSKGIRARIKQP